MSGVAEFGHDGAARAGAEHNERETTTATHPNSPSIIARERLGRSLGGCRPVSQRLVWS
jgi:hypothetical protein